MPRFYFNLHFDHDNARDPIGVELCDLNQAIAEAKKARLEIMDEEALDQLWLEIMDEGGHVVAKGRLAPARRASCRFCRR